MRTHGSTKLKGAWREAADTTATADVPHSPSVHPPRKRFVDNFQRHLNEFLPQRRPETLCAMHNQSHQRLHCGGERQRTKRHLRRYRGHLLSAGSEADPGPSTYNQFCTPNPRICQHLATPRVEVDYPRCDVIFDCRVRSLFVLGPKNFDTAVFIAYAYRLMSVGRAHKDPKRLTSAPSLTTLRLQPNTT